MTAPADNSDRAAQPVDAERSQPSSPSRSSVGDETNKSVAGGSVSADGLTAVVGRRIRDYELLELLGQGGMGSVWKAKHTRLKKLVALKLLPQEKTSDAAAVARFNREMEAVGQLRHPHIIEAHDAGEEAGTHYLVMDYVAGVELAELSKKVGQFPVADSCELMRQTALGLQHAFEHGLVHRDIKPSNLLLAQDGQLKILDLGLALLLGDQPGAELTSTGQVMGTLDYIAPEQLADTHAVDIRADLYSLGCTLFRLLTTEPPFAGPSLNTAAKKMFAHSFTAAPKLIDRRPDVPAELSALVARLLEKKPDARFATPREVATALAPFCVGHNLPALLASSSAPTSAPDPFASTVIPNVAVIAPRDEPRAIDSLPTTDAPHPTDLQAESISPNASRATEPLSSNHAAPEGSSRGAMTATLNAATPRRRQLLIVGALLAIVLLSVFLPPFLKRDASLTETTTTHPGEPGGVSPRTNPNTTDVRGLTPPGSPNPKSEISNSKSQIPADPDRAAAEWVLSQKGDVVQVEIITTQDGQRRSAKVIADLPKEPFQLGSVQLVNAPDVDAAALERHLGLLKSLCFVALEHSPRINDDVVSFFKQMPALKHFNLVNTGVTADGIVALVTSVPIQSLGVDGRQFSPKLPPLLAKAPSLLGIGVNDVSDEQLRQLFVVKQLLELNPGNRGKTELRHSTWARLADELPNLRSMSIDNVQFDDADLASIVRLTKLENLFLTRIPNVTDVGLTQLASVAKLKNLGLRGCAVTSLGLADFLESHPACQVVWDGADHRAVAEWVLSVGGKVQVAGRGAEWLDASARRGSPDPAAPADRRSPPSDEATKPRRPRETCGPTPVRGQETRAQRSKTRAQRHWGPARCC